MEEGGLKTFKNLIEGKGFTVRFGNPLLVLSTIPLSRENLK
jgi:hypothetical protein